MPHIVLEYSSNIKREVDYINFFREIHREISALFLIDPANFKSRTVRHDHFFIADGEENQAFVHITLSLFEGRPAELKKEIGKRIIRLAELYFVPAADQLKLQITLEIKDIQKEMYFKSTHAG